MEKDFLQGYIVAEQGRMASELKEDRLRLGLSKKLFTVRVMRHWHRLPRGVVGIPSLLVFEARLDGALSNQV